MTSSASGKGHRKLPFALAHAVDQACDRFESARRAGARPAIEEFLSTVPVEAQEILRDELITLEVRYRRRAGETPRAEDYNARFPALDPTWLASVLATAPEPDTVPEAPPMFEPGSTGWPVVPGYDLLGVLGEGGMGVVYKARHHALQRLVALKMILPSRPAEAPALLARFRAEAEALARLQHPNIVQIFEVGEAGDRPYLALEYLEGGSLEKRLAGTPQPPRAAARLVEVLARAMHAAHQCQIVHRDLKPANILLQAIPGAESVRAAEGTGVVDLDRWVPKITDFGVAKFLDVGRAQTQTGMVIGTPSYMAPEQARGRSQDIGPATDTYTLGAILYELLTGRPPFKGASPVETLEQVVSQEPVSPTRLQPKVPRDLVTICLRCLQKEPRRRYASAGALAEDLNRFLAGRPIQARPIGPGGRLWRWCRRNPALASADALAVVVLITVSILAVGIPFAARLAETADRLRRALREAETYRLRSDALSARLALDRNVRVCEQGDIGRGVLLLARSLQDAPGGMADLQRVVRADLAHWSRELHPLRTCLDHASPILTVTWSPDGRLLLTGGRGRTAPAGETVYEARLWDAATGRLLRSLPHGNTVRAAAFSTDGRRLVTGSEDHLARLWDTATGELLWQRPHGGAVTAVAISPDGRTVLTGGWDRTIRLWETATGKPIGEPCSGVGIVQAVAYSPDGLTILAGSRDNKARLWELPAPGQPWPRPRYLPHQFAVWAVAFSRDGKTIPTGDGGGLIHFWEASTGNPRQPVARLAHQAYLTGIAVSADGTFLTASEDATARLWDTATGLPLGPPLRHAGGVWGVAFHPDGRHFLTGCWDGTARRWERGRVYRPVQSLKYRAAVRAVDFSRLGQIVLLAGQGKQAQIWDLDAATPRARPSPPKDKTPVGAAVFSRDGHFILTGSSDQIARLWSVDQDGGQLLHELRGHKDAVGCVAIHPDGRLLLTGSLDGSARLWDAATGQEIRVVRHLEQRGKIHTVAFHPNGRTFLTGGNDHTARLWDVDDREAPPAVFRHTSTVLAAAFSPDGGTLLTGTHDGTAWLWDVATGKSRRTTALHTGPIQSVAFRPDGRTFLTGSTDGTARLWDVATAEPIGQPLRHSNWVFAVAFRPDGRVALTGCKDKCAYLWEVPDPVEGDPSRILLWAEVLTGMELDSDGALRVLDAATWQQRRQHLEELGGSPLP